MSSVVLGTHLVLRGDGTISLALDENVHILKEDAYDALIDGIGQLKVENAKLRELIKLMQICIEHACMCDFCPLFVSEDMDEQRCIAEIDSRMRALETEVD